MLPSEVAQVVDDVRLVLAALPLPSAAGVPAGWPAPAQQDAAVAEVLARLAERLHATLLAPEGGAATPLVASGGLPGLAATLLAVAGVSLASASLHAWLFGEGAAAEEEEALTCEYDPEVINAYFARRPVRVMRRATQVGGGRSSVSEPTTPRCSRAATGGGGRLGWAGRRGGGTAGRAGATGGRRCGVRNPRRACRGSREARGGGRGAGSSWCCGSGLAMRCVGAAVGRALGEWGRRIRRGQSMRRESVCLAVTGRCRWRRRRLAWACWPTWRAAAWSGTSRSAPSSCALPLSAWGPPTSRWRRCAGAVLRCSLRVWRPQRPVSPGACLALSAWRR